MISNFQKCFRKMLNNKKYLRKSQDQSSTTFCLAIMAPYSFMDRQDQGRLIQCLEVKLGNKEESFQELSVIFIDRCKNMILTVTAFMFLILRFITNKAMIYLIGNKSDCHSKNGKRLHFTRMCLNKFILKTYQFMSATQSKQVLTY